MRIGKLATYYVTRDMAPHPHRHQRHARDEAHDGRDVEKTAEHWHWLVSVRDCNYFAKRRVNRISFDYLYRYCVTKVQRRSSAKV